MRPSPFALIANTLGEGIKKSNNITVTIGVGIGVMGTPRTLLVPGSQRHLSGGSNMHVGNGTVSKPAIQCW